MFWLTRNEKDYTWNSISYKMFKPHECIETSIYKSYEQEKLKVKLKITIISRCIRMRNSAISPNLFSLNY